MRSIWLNLIQCFSNWLWKKRKDKKKHKKPKIKKSYFLKSQFRTNLRNKNLQSHQRASICNIWLGSEKMLNHQVVKNHPRTSKLKQKKSNRNPESGIIHNLKKKFKKRRHRVATKCLLKELGIIRNKLILNEN